MAGVELRDMGTTAQFAPRIKRGTARLSDGRSVVIVPDTNISTANGDDVTGTAKLYVYVSTNAARTAFTLHQTHTTGVAFASSTRYAVMSCAVREDGNLHVVYQGTDNSLRHIRFAWSGTAYGAGAEQTIVAAGAITNRFRAVDIDTVATNTNIIVAAYEAAAASGVGAFARVYARMSDDVTWTRAYSSTIMVSPDAIRDGSEDISIAVNKAGISANVAQFALYWTNTPVSHDHGDTIRELSFNFSTGTTDSATVVGTWKTALYEHQAAGARRGYLFSEANNVWMFGATVGSSVSFFAGARLYHNVFTGIVFNQTSVAIYSHADPYLRIIRTTNAFTAVSAEYQDYNLVFSFVGTGVLTAQVLRSVVIKFSSNTATPSATRVDNAARIMDTGYTIGTTGVIATYGGGNKYLTSGLDSFNFGVMYGASGNSVSATPGTLSRKFRAVAEDTISAPQVLSPVNTVVTTDRPTIRVQGQNAALYSSVLGKLEFQVASDSGFTTNLKTITQADSALNSYSATSGTVPPIRTMTHTLEGADSLFTGTWYLRARVVDDLGGESAWSTTVSFSISHPPVATPVTPANGISQLYGGGSPTFDWTFSDPEIFDSQSAYRLVIIRNDTGATVHDSGKVISSSKSVSVAISSGLKDIPLQWSVMLWDSDDTAGPFSSANVFTLVDPPVVAVTAPTSGSTINTALPTVTWTFTVGGTRFQRAYRIRIWDVDASPDEEVYDTGWVFSNAVSWTSAEQILEEGVNYRADVSVLDNLNLGDDDSTLFDTDWLPPIQITTAAVVADEFKATLTWDNSDNDTDWVGYRIYRRWMEVAIEELDIDATATTWKLIGEVTDVQTNYTFYDYTLPLNKAVDYVVVQVADRFGDLLESDILTHSTVTSVGDRYYFVPEVPVGTIASFEASYVTGDNFTRDIEQNTLHVIGRGRQVQVGDDLGYSGTLTLHLRNPSSARVDREYIEYLSGNRAGNIYIRTPFGDVHYVSFGNVSTNRIAGVGTEDLVDISVPYTTVYGEVTLTRPGT